MDIARTAVLYAETRERCLSECETEPVAARRSTDWEPDRSVHAAGNHHVMAGHVGGIIRA